MVMCLAQGPQHSDAGEAGTHSPSVSSQALYHLATVLTIYEGHVSYITIIKIFSGSLAALVPT